MEKFKEALLNFFLGLVFGIPVSILNGFITSDIWRWFVSPALHVPLITWQQGIGLNVAINWFSFGITWWITVRTASHETPTPAWLNTIIVGILSLLIWGIAAIWANVLHFN